MGDQEHVEIPLKIEWPLKFIDQKKKCILPRSGDDPDFMVHNSIIERERGKYWKVITDFLLREQTFTISNVISEARQNKNNVGIYEYIEAKIKARLRTTKLKDKIKYPTAKCHRTSLRWIKDYTEAKHVNINNIDCEWIERYAAFLSGYMQESAVHCRVKDLKSYLRIAFKERIIFDLDFTRYDNAPVESDPVYLEDSEVKLLLDHYNKPDISRAEKRDTGAFLFACFTGLRISDLERWNKSWVEGSEFVFTQVKGRLSARPKKPLRIPIIPLAKGFIDDLQNETFELTTPQKFNFRLKMIASNAGIKKNLTTHVARHTFGTQLAVAGVPVLIISKLMGHKKVETTMVYIHIAESVKAKAMMKLQDAFAGW